MAKHYDFDLMLDILLAGTRYSDEDLNRIHSSFGYNYIGALKEFKTVGFITPRQTRTTTWLATKVVADKNSVLIVNSRYDIEQVKGILTDIYATNTVEEAMQRIVTVSEFLNSESPIRSLLGPGKITNIYVDDAQFTLKLTSHYEFYDILARYSSLDFTIVLVK